MCTAIYPAMHHIRCTLYRVIPAPCNRALPLGRTHCPAFLRGYSYIVHQCPRSGRHSSQNPRFSACSLQRPRPTGRGQDCNGGSGEDDCLHRLIIASPVTSRPAVWRHIPGNSASPASLKAIRVLCKALKNIKKLSTNCVRRLFAGAYRLSFAGRCVEGAGDSRGLRRPRQPVEIRSQRSGGASGPVPGAFVPVDVAWTNRIDRGAAYRQVSTTPARVV